MDGASAVTGVNVGRIVYCKSSGVLAPITRRTQVKAMVSGQRSQRNK